MKGSIRQRTPGSYELTIDIGHIELTKPPSLTPVPMPESTPRSSAAVRS